MVPPQGFADVQAPSEITLELNPRSRFELIDVNARLSSERSQLDAFPKAVYCSHHTTAGYLDQNLCDRLEHNPESVGVYLEAFQALFPPEADYLHDQMDLREELSEAQRLVEPRNADSHLTYIGSGLGSCVTYQNRPDRPVYFVELDGVSHKKSRVRRTTVIGYNRGIIEAEIERAIPVSDHPMDSINLRDPRIGFVDELHELIRAMGVRQGRVDIALARTEPNAGLTVNEYETLLMRSDLMEVLRNPMRFVAEKGYHMLKDPRAIPGKAKNYAKYDLVRAVNKFIDKTGLNESVVERILDKFLSVPASRFLRMKRSISMLVTTNNGELPKLLQGQYQSPILVQWRKAPAGARNLVVRIVRFE